MKDQESQRRIIIIAVLIIAIFILAYINKIKNNDTADNAYQAENTYHTNNSVTNQNKDSNGEIEFNFDTQNTEENTEENNENAETDSEEVEENNENDTASDSGDEVLADTQNTVEFRNDKLLRQHFEKHGMDMGFYTKEDYEAAAQKVVSNPDALHKNEKEDGDDVYYLEETNEFVVVSVDGYIRTYFCPYDGIDYFNRQ